MKIVVAGFRYFGNYDSFCFLHESPDKHAVHDPLAVKRLLHVLLIDMHRREIACDAGELIDVTFGNGFRESDTITDLQVIVLRINGSSVHSAGPI
jgi:hypothetical protein